MTAADYEKILSALRVTSEVIRSHRGELSPTDLRIRSLLDFAAKEANRALLKAEHQQVLAADSVLPAMEFVPVHAPQGTLPFNLPADAYVLA